MNSPGSSRSTSPSHHTQQPMQITSFIPQPRTQNFGNRQQPPLYSSQRVMVGDGTSDTIRIPKSSIYSGIQTPSTQQNKNSVLDKFKLFGNKDKNQECGKQTSVGVAKRMSGSSGFSSARSERSDSFSSLCDQNKVQLDPPKSKALKSKFQSKSTKQINTKTMPKEEIKTQSKIGRLKAHDKQVNNPVITESSKSIGKVMNNTNSRPRPVEEKKYSNCDYLKQSNQYQRTNITSTSSNQTFQETKFITNLKPKTKSIQKQKVDPSVKILDCKVVHPLQATSNGLNEDISVEKRLSGRDIISSGQNHEDTGRLIKNQEQSINRIHSINQANQSRSETGTSHNVNITDNICKPIDHDNLWDSQLSYLKKQHIDIVNENEDVPKRKSINSRNSESDIKKCSIQPITETSEENLHKQTEGDDPNNDSNVHLTLSGISRWSSIPKPTAMVKATSKPPKENTFSSVSATATKLKTNRLHRKQDPNTIAMVSPMPNNSDLISDSSHNNANTSPNSTNNRSIVYRPNNKSGVEVSNTTIKKEASIKQEDGSSETNCDSGSVSDEEGDISIKPMKPLMRGYLPRSPRSMQTLPTRANQYITFHSSSYHCVGQDYADIDISSGYLSDGEVLRTGINVDNQVLSDLCDGYMSESGASHYARKMNPAISREHESFRYAGNSRQESCSTRKLVNYSRGTQKKVSGRTDDGQSGTSIECMRGDNGSGVVLGTYSGGNDALAKFTIEDLKSASILTTTNHQPNHPIHHKRGTGSGSACVGGGSGPATPQGAGQQSNNIVYRVVNSRHHGNGHVKKSNCSQQTDNTSFKSHQNQQQQQYQSANGVANISNSQQWKKYIEAGAGREKEREREREKDGTPPSPTPSKRVQDKSKKQTMAEYTNGEKPQKVSSSTSAGNSKVRGVPQSFGYVKRHSANTNPSPNGIQNGTKEAARTAQVSAVPRTKVKVSGGTQTCTTELQANSTGNNQGPHNKSYSLTGTSASQLSQSVRDRLMLGSQSLPKPGSPEFTAFFAASHHRERGSSLGPTSSSFSNRVLKPSDGSLSDTCSNYAAPDIQGYYAPNSPYSNSWMRHSNTYTAGCRSQGMGVSEADSIESLSSHRASLTHARLLIQRDSTGSPAPTRLNRSNSIRSTKSEKMYPSIMARGNGASSSVGEEGGVGMGMCMGMGSEPYYSVPIGSTNCVGPHWSQPASPTPAHPRQAQNLYQHVHKDDEIHGSSVSLVSTASSLYSSAEEKQAHEVRKLRRELLDAQEKVHSLTSQLSTNAHVVSAFEQSLSSMTQRLQQLTATAEKKDTELQELRETIERLRKQSAEASLNNGPITTNGRRHTLDDSDAGTTGCTGNSNRQGTSIARQLSADSVTSLNSLSSACSASSHHKKKGWLRSSFSKAFSRSRKTRQGSVSDVEDCKDGAGGELNSPNSPRLSSMQKQDNFKEQDGDTIRHNEEKTPEEENILCIDKNNSNRNKEEDEDVDELKKQLREKDLVLTDIRLEALSSAHQLESLKDTVIKMRNEMLNLKQNNERLQRLVTSKSLTSSQSSIPSDPERRFSMTDASNVAVLSNGYDNEADVANASDKIEDLDNAEYPVTSSSITGTTGSTGVTAASLTESCIEQEVDGKRINVVIYLGSEKTFQNNLGNVPECNTGDASHCIIANICISNKTTWDALDMTVKRCFKEYVSRVDPLTNLGLGVECVASYHFGEASRCTTDAQYPELLPCGYLVGHVKTIYLVLSGYSWLAIDTLIPRSIVHRLVSLLTEHRRVILCGPSGTGKSYLAGKLAQALAGTSDIEVKDAAAVATFNVDHKSSKELRQYLAHIAERSDSSAADELPRVIILENLQHAASLGELFSGLLGTRHSSYPAIIGTMSQATCSTTNLQLHHNFRWVLCANHMEPVKGFLGRYLRRKLLEHELRDSGGSRNAEMAAVVEWLPRVWQHLNKFLETHSSSDVTIGPRLFLSCPMEVSGSQVWFTDLWNYSVVPYLMEAVREGMTLYCKRGSSGSANGTNEVTWEDPTQFISGTYPWVSVQAVHGGSDALLRLRSEDVGFDVVSSGHVHGESASSVKSLGSTHSDTEGDPLLNMLMRLQEAANYSGPHNNDNDSMTSRGSSHTRIAAEIGSNTSLSGEVEPTP